MHIGWVYATVVFTMVFLASLLYVHDAESVHVVRLIFVVLTDAIAFTLFQKRNVFWRSRDTGLTDQGGLRGNYCCGHHTPFVATFLTFLLRPI